MYSFVSSCMCYVKRLCVLPQRVVTRGLCGILKIASFVHEAGTAQLVCQLMSRPVFGASLTPAREAPFENTDPGASLTLLIQAGPPGG